MVYAPGLRRAVLIVGTVLAGCFASGCGGSGSADGRFASWPTVTLIAFNDQWASSLPRYYDVADLLFKKTLAPGTIQFRYDPSTSESCLVGEIKGWGLKPNFCYQLKLMGKPGVAASASRARPVKPTPTTGLWGNEADMATNAAILTNARWWSYSQETANFNTTSPSVVLASTDYANGWVAGYVYFGYVLTDENGNIKCYGGKTAPALADTNGWVPIKANRCYHITAKTGQESGFEPAYDTVPLEYTLQRTSYGYTSATQPATLRLWYEKEPDNALDFALPAGQHDVVLMVTEESFHNNLGGLTSTTDGGFWDTVWVSDWPTTASPKTGAAWVAQRGGRIQFATGAAAAAPVAAIVSPADGGTVPAETAVTVRIRATASRDVAVTYSIDGGAAQAAAYNEASACYEGVWNTAGLIAGSSHTIIASATDSAQLISMATSTVTVAGNQPPTAAFTVGKSGLACTFTSQSADPDGSIVSWAWNYGDGATGTGAAPSHTYAAAGTYTVTLTVTDDGGATAQASQPVTVAQAANVMTPSIEVVWLGSSGSYQPHARVLVKANGLPLAGAVVTGNFSGTFNSKASSVTTDATGYALFYGPPRNRTTGPLTFTVTKLVKTSYTAGTLPVSASYAP